MIQFNLLPNVKVEYITVKRTKHRVLGLATGVIIASLAVVVMLIIVVFAWQSVRLKSLDKSIKETSQDLKSQADINKVLTVQNQLKSIDGLHAIKPEVGRIFNYLAQVTPSKTTIATLGVDFVTPLVSLTGQTSSLEEVNKFVDTLKFTTITRGDAESSTSDPKAFTQVVLSSYGLDSKGASFTITLSFDPAIFDSNETDLTLTVPKITTTRSETEAPAALFQENVTPLPEVNP